ISRFPGASLVYAMNWPSGERLACLSSAACEVSCVKTAWVGALLICGGFANFQNQSPASRAAISTAPIIGAAMDRFAVAAAGVETAVIVLLAPERPESESRLTRLRSVRISDARW